MQTYRQILNWGPFELVRRCHIPRNSKYLTVVEKIYCKGGKWNCLLLPSHFGVALQDGRGGAKTRSRLQATLTYHKQASCITRQILDSRLFTRTLLTLNLLTFFYTWWDRLKSVRSRFRNSLIRTIS